MNKKELNMVQHLNVSTAVSSKKSILSTLTSLKYSPSLLKRFTKIGQSHEIQGECYAFICNEHNQVIITVNKKTATCVTDSQELQFNGFSGVLKCPKKLKEFCQIKRPCPNDCSQKGYCLKGIC